MQVYLPDNLFKVVKARKLPASELLQRAVRADVRRQDLLQETERYLEHLTAGVGSPPAAQRTRMQLIADWLGRRGATAIFDF